MTKPAGWPSRILIKGNEERPDAIINFDLTDAEGALLNEFLAEEKRFSSCGPMQNGIKVGLDISAAIGKPTTARRSGLSADEEAVLLHNLRPFLLEKERTFVPSVCKLLGRRMENDWARDQMKAVRDTFLGKRNKGFDVLVNNESANTEKRLKDWLNSVHYHRDQGLKETVEFLKSSYPGDFMEGIFWMMIINKINSITFLSDFIQWIPQSGIDEGID